MNIKDFMAWRPYCVFCNEELIFTIQFPNYPLDECEKPEYFIKDEALHFVSRYVSLTVDIISGYVDSPDKHKPEIAAFISRQDLEVRAECGQCAAYNRFYRHAGFYKGNQNLTHMTFFDVREIVVVDNMYLHQSRTKRSALANKLTPDGKWWRTRKIDDTPIPYIDLSKIKPETLANKIKTCIIFS